MLKNSFFKRFAISSLFLLLALILYNFPKELSLKDKIGSSNYNVYLSDRNDYVSLVNVSCGIKYDDEVKGMFELLTNSECFPYGFSSYVPKSTKLLNYSVDNDLLKLNFNEGLFLVKSGYEEKMLESLIYSFTSIESIEKIMIFVNGNILDRIPNTGSLLPTTLDRSFGINKIVDLETFSDSVSFNVYYLSKADDWYYHVPVTYIVNENDDVAQMIIKRLKSSSVSSLLSHLNYNVEMISYEIDDNIMGITFDDDLKNILFDGELSESIEYALVASFKDTFGVKDVDILFNS